MQGIIVKAISGFYYVYAEEQLYECKARGVFKKRGITPLVGDDCIIEFGQDNSVTVTEILPRRNAFERPPAANVETMVIVCAAKDPEPAFTILDRFTVTAEDYGTQVIICVNKTDIADGSMLDAIKRAYSGVYPLYFVSAQTGEGIRELKEALHGKRAALAGPSGVGKSSLTNLLLGRDASQVGEISSKSLRGKNTTRHTELFISDGFALFDTPGFTSFDAVSNPSKELDRLFPEMAAYLGECRFDNCKHIKEPDCAVHKAVAEGLISERRYQSYTEIYKTIQEQKRY